MPRPSAPTTVDGTSDIGPDTLESTVILPGEEGYSEIVTNVAVQDEDETAVAFGNDDNDQPSASQGDDAVPSAMPNDSALPADTKRSLPLSQSRRELIDGIFGAVQSYLERQEKLKVSDADAGGTTYGPNVTRFNNGYFRGQCHFLAETIKTLPETVRGSSTIDHPNIARAIDVKQDTTQASNKPSTTQRTVDKHREHKSTATVEADERSALLKNVNTGIALAVQATIVTMAGAISAMTVIDAAKKYSRWR